MEINLEFEMKTSSCLFTLVLIASISMVAMVPPKVPPPPPPLEEVFSAIDVVCGNLVDTNADWATRAFTEREGHFFCSEECLERYLELMKETTK
jgi:YHS domain-containing protein